VRKSQISLSVYGQVRAAPSLTSSPVPQGVPGVGLSRHTHFAAQMQLCRPKDDLPKRYTRCVQKY
jgi:hypothetical protein